MGISNGDNGNNDNTKLSPQIREASIFCARCHVYVSMYISGKESARLDREEFHCPICCTPILAEDTK